MGKRLKKKRRPSTSAFLEDEHEHEDIFSSQEPLLSPDSKRIRLGSLVSSLHSSPLSPQGTFNSQFKGLAKELDPNENGNLTVVSSNQTSNTTLDPPKFNTQNSPFMNPAHSEEDLDHLDDPTPRRYSYTASSRFSPTDSPSLLSKTTIHTTRLPSLSPFKDSLSALSPSFTPPKPHMDTASASFSSVPKNLFLVPTKNTHVTLDPSEIALEKELTKISSTSSNQPSCTILPSNSARLTSTKNFNDFNDSNDSNVSNFSSWLLRLAVRSSLDLSTLIQLHLSCSCSRSQTEHLALLESTSLSSSHHIPWTSTEDSYLLSQNLTLHHSSLLHKSPQAIEQRKLFLNYVSKEKFIHILNLSYALNLRKKS